MNAHVHSVQLDQIVAFESMDVRMIRAKTEAHACRRILVRVIHACVHVPMVDRIVKNQLISVQPIHVLTALLVQSRRRRVAMNAFVHSVQLDQIVAL